MKKFMILLLAIGMLFSFAACSNESDTTVSGGLAASIYSDSDVVRVAGEKVSVSDFVFKGLDSFNNPVSIDSSDIMLVEVTSTTVGEDDDAQTITNANVVDSITLSNPSDTTKAGTQTIYVKTAWGATGAVDVTVLPVTKVEVSGTPSVKEYKKVVVTDDTAKQYKKIDSTGMTVKVTYIDEDGATQTKNVDNSLVKFGLAGNAWDTVAPTVKVTVEYAGVDATGDTWNVAVVANRVKSLEAKVAADYELIADGTTTLNTDKFVVYGIYEDGQKTKLTADSDVKYSIDENYDAAKKNYNTASTITFAKGTAKATTVYVEYQGELAVGGNAYTSAPITVREDYIKGLKVVLAEGFTLAANYDYSEGSTTDLAAIDKITVTAEYAGKTAAISLDPKTDWTIDPIKAAANLVSGKSAIEVSIVPVDGGKADIAGTTINPVKFTFVVGTAVGTGGLTYGVTD